jgi:hypothetical protein
MKTLDVFICQENISLYKKLLADRNITDGQREMIGKILAEEEAKLLKLFDPQAQTSNELSDRSAHARAHRTWQNPTA